MTTKRHKGPNGRRKRGGHIISARVNKDLKDRLASYCQRPDVNRDGSFVQRQALEEFLTAREKEGAKP